MEATDRIHIRDLSIACIIGLNPDERLHRQEVIVNVSIDCDLRGPGQSDDISDTLDYRALKNEIMEVVEKSDYLLIEALAERVAGLCLACPGARAVRVTVDKPGALTFARSVAVEIFRTRPGSDGGAGAA